MPRRCSFKLEIGFPQPLAGVDEAGCAPLAGPVVAAAIILDREKFPRGIDDSKNLPLETREALYAKLVKCASWGVGVATVEEIDSINIYWARMLAMTRAVEALGIEPAWVLVDGNTCPRWQRPSKAIVDGDAKCRSIAAASIIAKVTRDRMMVELAGEYPGYGWETNRGYGTPAHQRALREKGPTPLHRRSFAPVRAIEAQWAQPQLPVIEIVPAESFESHPPQFESAPIAGTQDVVLVPSQPHAF
ncbi:ribonuclease HII [Sphingomonas sinipercae]|uniref:Ribonuclease HII n=1 Tax=Sphingomonas sinipercae TaxID=2714944 RepID=A0A6G7ZNE1_9SPHN|nr:ribonuclease HII [Sphingomonas sinipercae]